MSKEKGILTKELEGLVVKGLDKLIKAKGVAEAGSDMIIRMFVPLVDNHIADRLKDSIKLPLREAGGLLVEEKYEEAAVKFADVLNAMIDIPGVDELIEEKIARKQFEVFVLLIQAVLDSKKNKEN